MSVFFSPPDFSVFFFFFENQFLEKLVLKTSFFNHPNTLLESGNYPPAAYLLPLRDGLAFRWLLCGPLLYKKYAFFCVLGSGDGRYGSERGSGAAA